MPHIAWPRVIYDGDQLVGFIMAAFAPEHENPLFHSYLWRLNIGAEHQGKGYGRLGLPPPPVSTTRMKQSPSGSSPRSDSRLADGSAGWQQP